MGDDHNDSHDECLVLTAKAASEEHDYTKGIFVTQFADGKGHLVKCRCRILCSYDLYVSYC